MRLGVDLGRVLYVENNVDSLGLVTAMLSRFADVEVIPASQGHIAIDLARVQLPDVVLLDVDLPDMSALDLMRLLRSDVRTLAVPIIAIGASISAASEDELLAAGAAKLLAKPFTIEDLFGALTEVFRAPTATG